MLAHTDAVSAVAVIPENDCVITASHDSSIRFWCVSTRRIFADISAHQTHRKKHDEVCFFEIDVHYDVIYWKYIIKNRRTIV